MPFNSATILRRLRWSVVATAWMVASLTIAVDAQGISPRERAAANQTRSRRRVACPARR